MIMYIQNFVYYFVGLYIVLGWFQVKNGEFENF